MRCCLRSFGVIGFFSPSVFLFLLSHTCTSTWSASFLRIARNVSNILYCVGSPKGARRIACTVLPSRKPISTKRRLCGWGNVSSIMRPVAPSSS